MSILVKELRLSLVWNKKFPRDTFLPYLEDPDRYSQEFGLAQQGAGSWLLPWLPDKRQYFWQLYLLRKAPGDFHSIAAQDARQYFVPLRAPTWVKECKARSGVKAVLGSVLFSS